MKRRWGKRVQAIAVVGIASLLFTGCGAAASPDGASSSQEPADDGGVVSTLEDGLLREDEGGDPVEGGTLRWAAYAEPRSLDPAVTIVASSTGGLEMANLYDVVARWDADAGEFVPRTAESIEPNGAFDQWTVEIRDGITFSDGTPYDAAAVKASQDRYASMPAPEAGMWKQNVASVEVTGDHTLVYTLTKPWKDFPSILSTGPGMIVGAGAGEGESFTPIGAGPFVLEKWEPAQSISFTARDDYWDGAPRLDGFVSVFLNDQQVGIDSLESGSVDAAFALQANFVQQLVDGGHNGIASAVNGGSIAIINAEEGFPGHDVRVRKAIQLAIDPQVLMERAFEGAVDGESSLFPAGSAWAGEARAPEPDVDAAKDLLEEAMADGYDGKLEYLDGADPASRNRALAVEAQLEAAGFDVELTLTRTIADRIKRIAQDKDYQMSAWSLNLRDSDPLPRLFSNMHSTGTQTYLTHTSEAMDALIEEFQVATTPDEQGAAMNRIQEQMNEDVPFVSWARFVELLAWSDQVHGVIGSANSTVLLNEAWKAEG